MRQNLFVISNLKILRHQTSADDFAIVLSGLKKVFGGEVHIMPSGKIPMGNLLSLRKTLKLGEVLTKGEVYENAAM